MGHGFKGDTGHYHTIGENIGSLKSKYSFNEKTGYFGTVGQSKQSKVRNISSDDPVATAKDFYDRAAYGGKEEPLGNGKGFKTTMKDGSVLTYREVSSSSDGSPAIDITISSTGTGSGGIKTQKIHFVKKTEDKK